MKGVEFQQKHLGRSVTGAQCCPHPLWVTASLSLAGEDPDKHSHMLLSLFPWKQMQEVLGHSLLHSYTPLRLTGGLLLRPASALTHVPCEVPGPEDHMLVGHWHFLSTARGVEGTRQARPFTCHPHHIPTTIP